MISLSRNWDPLGLYTSCTWSNFSHLTGFSLLKNWPQLGGHGISSRCNCYPGDCTLKCNYTFAQIACVHMKSWPHCPWRWGKAHAPLCRRSRTSWTHKGSDFDTSCFVDDKSNSFRSGINYFTQRYIIGASEASFAIKVQRRSFQKSEVSRRAAPTPAILAD